MNQNSKYIFSAFLGGAATCVLFIVAVLLFHSPAAMEPEYNLYDEEYYTEETGEYYDGGYYDDEYEDDYAADEYDEGGVSDYVDEYTDEYFDED